MIHSLRLWLLLFAAAVSPWPSHARADDEIPSGMVTFFEAESCPADWQEAEYARGRLPLFTKKKELVGQTHGDAMKTATPPVHAFDSGALVLNLKSRRFAGANNCSNPAGAAGHYQWPYRCLDSDGALPYVHYLFCERMGPRREAAADPLPFGTYGFFHRRDGVCPQGWVVDERSDGRFPMPLMEGGEIGDTVSRPWEGGAEGYQTHSHTLTYKHSLARKGISPFGLFDRDGIADPNQEVSPSAGAARHLIPPFVRLLACRKNTFAAKDKADEIPRGMTLFMGGKECVDDWQRVAGSAGRFVVASPTGASSGRGFGGPPLNPKEDRIHHHVCSVEFHVSAQNLCLDGGSFQVAEPDSGRLSLDTSNAPAKVPYVQLSHCRWR